VFSIQYLTNDNYRIADREYKINASLTILRLLDLFDDSRKCIRSILNAYLSQLLLDIADGILENLMQDMRTER